MTASERASETGAGRGAGGRRGHRRRREQARAEVLRVALELAGERPFSELTVDEIARGAGLSRSAFYTHFRDKHDLLAVALGEVAEELGRMADDWWRGVGPPAERVRAALEGATVLYAEHAGLLRIAVEVATYDDDVHELWMGTMERLIEATAEHIRSEQAKGLVNGALDPRGTAESLVWMNERCAYVYLGRGERGPAELVEAMAPVWTAALYPGVIPAERLRPGTVGEAADAAGASAR